MASKPSKKLVRKSSRNPKKVSTAPTARISGHFEGNISAAGNLHIAQGAQCRANIRAAHVNVEGQFEGSMAARSGMRVGNNGKCRGSFNAKSLHVDGWVEGEAWVQDRMDLSANSSMKGQIVAGRLVVADGASFDGRCTIGKFAQEQAKGKKAA